MVKAILEGRKTQTRRIIKPQPGSWDKKYKVRVSNNVSTIRCPYGMVGDLLWVRETWRPIEQELGGPRYEYKATEVINQSAKWTPSIFMPKEACRIRLEITGVRAERLHDISDADAIAEGVGFGFQMNAGWPDYTRISSNGICDVTQDTPKMSFASLWQSINGNRSWECNPWVWVVEFARVPKTELA